MSTTIDQRVVEMQFDNSRFERNVATTMSTLEKFKQRLNLTGATKGLEDVSAAAENVKMSSLGNAIETVHSKFSALEIMGITALANITNSAVNAGKRIVSALTIDPIKTGFSEYETQINAVQTILANTESKGKTLTDVTSALDELNEYADKTIYNFTEMTRNIGTFTAAGVDLDKSVTSIKGIANLAAVSGSSSQQASTAMYQLSQALAAGKVSLMDWNSVVNAGMGGQVFQDALKRTATHMGHNVDEMIKKYGSFRESLTQGEWLTADVLTETLTQLSGAYSEADLIAQGYSKEQAQEITKLAETAVNAATKVKTFTQLWDTLKESAQSGWTQTWEIIVGDFEEAKELLTNVSNVIGDMIGKSAEARNNLLQGWKDQGGRTAIIEGLANAFEGLMSIIKPIGEAFREIFPPMTVKQLVTFSEGFRDLTEKFKISETAAANLKSTFKGIFGVIDIVVEVIKSVARGAVSLIKNFAGIENGILGVTGAIGNWLFDLRNSVTETNIFGTAIEKVVGFLSTAITKLKEFGSSLRESFESPGYKGFVGFLKGLWEIIQKIGSKIGKVFSALGSGLSEILNGTSLSNMLNSGLLSGILYLIFNMVTALNDPLDALSGFMDNLRNIMDNVSESFQEFTNNIKAGTLQKIAISIGILAVALILIASIDQGALVRSLATMAALFGELLLSFSIFSHIATKMKGVAGAIAIMIGMSIAVTILAGALKKIASINPEDIAKGLVAIAVLMYEISWFLQSTKLEGKVNSSAIGIVILSSAMLILAKAVKNFGSMQWEEIRKGLAAIGILLAELALFSHKTGKSEHVISTGVAMLLLGSAMKIFTSVVKDFSSMPLEEIGKGLLAIAGTLTVVTDAVRFMPENMATVGVGMIAIGAAMKILASVIKDFGSMQLEEIGKGLLAIAGTLTAVTYAVRFMPENMATVGVGMIAIGLALKVLASSLGDFGGMGLWEIVKGLATLAVTFAVIGGAAALLSPLVPVILGLAGAFALLGIGIFGIGAGLTAIGVGMTTIGAAGVAGATAFVAALTVIIVGIVDLIPTLIGKLGDIIGAVCVLIGKSAPQIADALLSLVAEVLLSLAEYTPKIVDGLFGFLIGLIEGLKNNIPKLLIVIADFIGSLFQGVIDALKHIDTQTLIDGILAVGLISALIVALSAVTSLIPSAMMGVLGIGAIIAEIGLVLAAIGGLAQIPGLKLLINEGGNFLQIIGTAIGQFVGGLVGGVAQGVTSSLPQIGTHLSDFMTNAQTFIEGAKNIDASVVEGVKGIASVILTLTAANILESLTSWITGGSSLTSFASQLPALGASLNTFATNLGPFNESQVTSITCATNALKVLAEAANSIPNEGGWISKIVGDNSIAAFGDQLPSFGTNLNAFATNLGSFDETKVNTVTCAANAVKALAEAADNINGQADWTKKLFGDNSIALFSSQLPELGTNLNVFATNLGSFDETKVNTVTCAADAITAMAEAAGNMDGQADWTKKLFGDNSLSSFSSQLPTLGSNLNAFATNLGTFGDEKVVTVEYAVKAIDAFAALADTDLKGAKKNLSDFGDRIAELAIDITSFCSDMPNNDSIDAAINNMKRILTMINDIASTDPSAATKFTNSLKDIGKAGVDAFVKAFTSDSAKKNVKQAASDLVDKASDGAESKESDLKSSFEDIVSSAISAVKSKTNYDGFYSAGTYLVTGFANGIDANTFEAEAKAAAMAKAAKQAAEAVLGIESPSKVFYGIGDFAGQGFVNALNDYAVKSYTAASHMADSARIGLSSTIGKIRDIIDSDIDTTPTIRPVLDTTNIESGVGTINSLLQMGASVGVSANVGTVSSMMNQRGQNGVNDDVVAAIKELRDNLDNVGNTTYNVNGVTYDDGSNISNAVASIVRAAKIERRV